VGGLTTYLTTYLLLGRLRRRFRGRPARAHARGESPSYPADIAEACNIPLGTVKNELTRLRGRGVVEYTGKTDPRTRAKEVRLTKHRDGLEDLQDATRGRGPVAPDEDIPVPSAP
jgi:hypothetical protein